jgi:NAD-dependent deacetylase
MNQRELQFAADAIRNAETVVALTGAGVSTPSGIPDFRSNGGVWDRFDPMDFHISRLERDPGGFWADRVAMIEDVFSADQAPNIAHKKLVKLEKAGYLDALITQNVDGLHQRAGHDEVIEIHGNGDRVVCQNCHVRYEAGPFYDAVRAQERPPHCPDCDTVLKPDVVLFGEALPEHALYRSHSLAEQADVFIVVGSSLQVEPAASLPRTAADNGAILVIINLEVTGVNRQVEYDFRADVTEALPRLHKRLVDI